MCLVYRGNTTKLFIIVIIIIIIYVDLLLLGLQYVQYILKY